MTSSEPRHIKVGSLRLFPPSIPADQQVQDELLSLWKSKHSFIILSGPPGAVCQVLCKILVPG